MAAGGAGGGGLLSDLRSRGIIPADIDTSKYTYFTIGVAVETDTILPEIMKIINAKRIINKDGKIITAGATSPQNSHWYVPSFASSFMNHGKHYLTINLDGGPPIYFFPNTSMGGEVMAVLIVPSEISLEIGKEITSKLGFIQPIKEGGARRRRSRKSRHKSPRRHRKTRRHH